MMLYYITKIKIQTQGVKVIYLLKILNHKQEAASKIKIVKDEFKGPKI